MPATERGWLRPPPAADMVLRKPASWAETGLLCEEAEAGCLQDQRGARVLVFTYSRDRKGRPVSPRLTGFCRDWPHRPRRSPEIAPRRLASRLAIRGSFRRSDRRPRALRPPAALRARRARRENGHATLGEWIRPRAGPSPTASLRSSATSSTPWPTSWSRWPRSTNAAGGSPWATPASSPSSPSACVACHCAAPVTSLAGEASSRPANLRGCADVVPRSPARLSRPAPTRAPPLRSPTAHLASLARRGALGRG